MSHSKRFAYKEIDTVKVMPGKLSETIDNYQELGYYVEVLPQIWKSLAGLYNTEYLIRILKVRELEHD